MVTPDTLALRGGWERPVTKRFEVKRPSKADALSPRAICDSLIFCITGHHSLQSFQVARSFRATSSRRIDLKMRG
jgi:hypothetical protein